MSTHSRRATRWSAIVTIVVVFVAFTAQAAFAPSVARDQSATAGTVTVNIAASGSGNRFSVDATHLLPGDTIDRVVNLTYTGTIAISALRLTTTATTSSLMDTDAVNGLQMTITRCSVAWDETMSGGIPTSYSCSGSTTATLGSSPVVTTNALLSSADTVATHTNYLLVELTLPHTAGNTFQNKHTVVQFQFFADQRTRQYS